jgi:AcrR family transcriptional regulator
MDPNESPAIKRRSRGRPSLQQAIELRESFLAAALQSFLQKGYAATSIEAIAREAGVAKITIYRHFDNKEALFRAVVQRATIGVRETIQTTLVQGGQNERQVLIGLIERMYQAYTDPRWLTLLRLVIAETVRFPELGELFYAHNDQSLLSPVIAYLAEAHQAGTLRVPSPEFAAKQLSSLCFGGMRLFITKPLVDREERAVWVEGIADLVLQGWAPRPEATAH